MKPYLTLLGGALMLAACSNTSAIQDAVKEDLIDPDSARFGDIIEYTDANGSRMACVMLNAKNRMGGYTGEKLVLVTRSDKGDWQALPSFPGIDCEYYVENIVDDAVRH